MSNKNLNKAKETQDNEFYTQLSEIEKELQHYNLDGLKVYCNCDGPNSEFLSYFKAHKGIASLESSYIKEDGTGSFSSPESIKLMSECDIVITNPPFSIFREYLDVLLASGKKFLIVGNMNAITYKEVFKLIKSEKMWLGVNYAKEFMKPDGSIQKFGNILWYTNLEHQKRREELILTQEFDKEKHVTYDNYDAIEVGRVANIPLNYSGVMGVPITYLMKHNPLKFEIVGNADNDKDPSLVTAKVAGVKINGVSKFKRLFIKAKQ